MIFWIFATIALIVQETVTTSAILMFSRTVNNSVATLTIIFLLVTSIQILIFHKLGKTIQEKGKSILIIHFVNQYLSRVGTFIEKRGSKLFLFIMAASIFPPSLTSFISSWLNLSFPQKFLWIMLGDFIWYSISWLLVVGAISVTRNPQSEIFHVVLMAIIYVILQRYVSKKVVEN